jgi:type IX secretion system PorP/SprF family membrane protein
MRKRLPILFTFCLLVSLLWGQQRPQYSLYMFNKLNWNPAYAGLDHSVSLTGGLRTQWTDIAYNPESQYVNVHAPLLFLSSGIGLGIENDDLGAERTTSIQFSYNYQLELGSGLLTLGVGGRMIQKNIDGTILRTPDGNYENIIDHQDDILPLINESATGMSFSAGVYYYSEQVEVGFSVLNLSEPTIDFPGFQPRLSRTYTAYAGANLELNSQLTLHPSVMVLSDFQQTQPQLSAILRYNDNIFGGASLRGYNQNTLDAVSVIAGFKLGENITFGYAYDISLSGLKVISNQSHEIMINYNLNTSLGNGIPPNIIYNPRNL